MSENMIFGLNEPRVLALFMVMVVLLAVAPLFVWPLVFLPSFLWLRLDKNSRAVALVEQIFDFRNRNNGKK